MTFTDGSTTLGNVALSGGKATLTISTLSPGHHDITATYSSDATYSSSSDDVVQTVHHVRTSTHCHVVGGRSTSGQAVTFTAIVTADGGPAPSSGTVTFTDGFHMLGTVAVSGGKATITISSLSAGVHVIAASYSGDSTYRSSADLLAQIVRASRR